MPGLSARASSTCRATCARNVSCPTRVASISSVAAVLTDPETTSSPGLRDRKSTRLNSSHVRISYAVFCLKKKKKQYKQTRRNEKKNNQRQKNESRTKK